MDPAAEADSAKRREGSKDWEKVAKNIARYNDQKKRKRVSLNEARFLAERAEVNADKEEEKELEKLANPNRPVFDTEELLQPGNPQPLRHRLPEAAPSPVGRHGRQALEKPPGRPIGIAQSRRTEASNAPVPGPQRAAAGPRRERQAHNAAAGSDQRHRVPVVGQLHAGRQPRNWSPRAPIRATGA